MNAPTLIVGLGGKGSEIALKVSQMVTEEQRQRIGFAVFDTDVNELSEIKRNNPFVHTIQTSTKLSVGEYLDIDTHARDTWFPVNAILNSKTLTEGAGQVRAVSRLAFETAVRSGKMEQLHQAIEDLYKLEGGEYEQAIRVIIVSSLAGGTGSGLILPVALYIKNYLTTHFRQSANIMRGFFILPEVFYEVIAGQSERNNLKSNAYACLRELDTFLMKADETLPDKYMKTAKVEFPSVASGGYEEYSVRPFDFCFLFDAQNADGKKLNSFEDYLNHAASCIYSQSIGPMNKRSNSSEDNTIRTLTAERGRNRYAGAGCSILKYPVEDVINYLSLSWAKNCVSDQWLVYDAMFKEQRRANEKKRNMGLRTGDLKQDRAYIDSVESNANNKDPFSMAVVNSTAKYDETGYTKEANKWDLYVMALKTKIDHDNSRGSDDLDDQQGNARKRIGEIEAGSSQEDWDKYVTAYEAMRLYHDMIVRRTEESAYTIAFSIFRDDDKPVTKDNQDFRVEYYMRDEEGKFIHPSAVRYFLYKTYSAMNSELRMVQSNVDALNTYFENFEKNAFDNPDTDDVEDVFSLSKSKKVSLKDKLFKKLSADQEDVIQKYNQYMRQCDELRVNGILAEVLKEGVKYIDSICKAFETFYMSLDAKIPGIDKRIKALEGKYTVSKGNATRYVCASTKCLNAMSKDMPYMGGMIEIDSDLAEEVYNRVRSYAMAEGKPANENYFTQLFDEGIVGYFKDTLMKTYGDEIDKDIITAIEKEANYEHGIYGAAELEEYVKSTFDEAKVLAAPFIEKPLGEEKDPINSCTYNKGLDPKDDSPRSKLIKAELKNFGGVPDDDIPKNLIMFYKSFYGLRANDLSKFAPPQKSETYSRTSGEYFRAYYELIEKINPDLKKSTVITPHIDRWWHTISFTPDLDDENQERQENDICAAFFWGIAGKYIQLYQDDANSAEMTYQLMLDSLGLQSDHDKTLIVSNGTACDRLYEVLDALYIYPELVKSILHRVDYERDGEVNENKPLEESALMNALSNFTVSEYPLNDKNPVRSIFDIPVLLKKSMIADVYDEERVLRVLRMEIAEIQRFTKKFCEPKEFVGVTGRIIAEQFDLFLKDMEIEKQTWKNLYEDYLFSRICDIIAVSLEEMGCKTEAGRVRKKKNELTK